MLAAGALAVCDARAGITPVGTAFTYQGNLRLAGEPINGTASLQFRLFNQAIGGAQVGPTLTACNQTVVDGIIKVDLDFGAVFEGSERWLEIGVQSPAGDCATFVILVPRQVIRPTPYALRSLAPWATLGSTTYYNDGNVGIGTSLPAANLELSKANATARITSTSANGTSILDLKGDSPDGLGGNVLGTLRFLDEVNNVRAEISSSEGLLANPLNFTVDGTTQMVLTDNGNLGVGTTLPLVKLQVVGGTDSEPADGGFIVLGATDSLNISIDNNEIMARNNGAAATLTLNNDGGDVSILPAGGGQVGIGTPPTSSMLTVFNSLFVNGGASPRIDVGPNGFILMDTGADITLTNGGLEVNTPSGGNTFFNRTAPDGTLIGFLNNGVSAGGISVVGTTVSYNTFTGSHHAQTDEPIAPGSLVVLTGNNQRAHPGPNCEVVYGIAPSTRANDPRCLGSYLCPPDPADTNSRHLVAAVGNGEMWVVDDGRGDVHAGDYLISSDRAGCAMLDDPARFAVGHIVARAAEDVAWSRVAAAAGEPKRALVSVFFESFDRHGSADTQRQAIEDVRRENQALRERLESLERQLQAITAGR